jgi:glycosyltransferase involved in cell wall biosynthesis
VKLTLLRSLDLLAMRCADVVLVDTQEDFEQVPPRLRPKAVVVPVGAAPVWFAARDQVQRGPDEPMRIVFFGLFTPLQGAATIGRALQQLSDRSDIVTTMIGRGQDWEEARAHAGDNPRISWPEWVDYTELPGVVASHDVCLGIFGTTPKALRVVPNKVFQGAAAGCAVVTSDTAPQRRALGGAAVFVPPGDSEALAEVVLRLCSDRASLQSLRQEAGRRSTAAFQASKIVVALRERLFTPPGSRSDREPG